MTMPQSSQDNPNQGRRNFHQVHAMHRAASLIFVHHSMVLCVSRSKRVVQEPGQTVLELIDMDRRKLQSLERGYGRMFK